MMTKMAGSLLALVLALGAGGAMSAGQGGAARPGSDNDRLRKVALVVGNAAYANALPLANPLNDASDVCGALRRLDFDVVCKLNVATKREFKDAIYEFSGKINEQTVAFFYFAGHGLQIDGLNYVIPTQAALRTKSDIEDESVQINYLMNELEARHAALNIFVLDACRDNPFVSPIRGYAPTLGLASQLYAPRNSIIAMSTGPGQLSLDGAGRNGTFTRNLLKSIFTPRQSVEDMFKEVSGATRAEAKKLGRRQDPQITTSYADRYCLAGCNDGTLAAGDGQKAGGLDQLQLALAQTRAKQQELDEQKAALLKKQEEIERIKATLQQAQARPAPRQDGMESINASIASSSDKLAELEKMKNALLKKQAELNAIRDLLSAQQAAIDAQQGDLRSRRIDVPDNTKKPVTIVPAF